MRRGSRAARACALISFSFLLFASPAAAEPLRIVMTGDSIANALTVARMGAAYGRAGIDAQAFTVAQGGATSARYVGREGTLNILDETLALNPDIVLINLGVNNAFQNRQTEFVEDLDFILDTYLGLGIKVVLGGLIPVLPHPENTNYYANAENRVRNIYNPHLEATAAVREGVFYVENYYAIQENENWLDWYSDDGKVPGYVHLWGGGAGPPGYVWLADQYASGVLMAIAIPEPASWLTALLALAGLALVCRRTRRRASLSAR